MFKKITMTFVLLTCLVIASTSFASNPSKFYEKLTLDKKAGTATITNPAYHDENLSRDFGFSANVELTNMDGVCKHFGFELMLKVNSVKSDAEEMAVVDETGEVSGYYGSENPEKNLRIETIVCQVKNKK